jgi:endo-1,4-beta-xylanase
MSPELLRRCSLWCAALGVAASLAACRPRKPVEPWTTPAPGTRAPAGDAGPVDASREPLKTAGARRERKIGVALATWFFEHPFYGRLAAHEFDSLTPENEMKWYAVEPQPGQFDFSGADRLVSFAKEHGMRVRGHTLVWHNQLAPWVKRLSGDDLARAMLNHVTRTAEHFRGQLAQWDVVNEAVGDDGELRKDSPFTALGPEYLDRAFKAAHAADPEARLYYNDYDVEDLESPKSQGAYRLVKRLKDAHVPIHGMGFQMHLDPRRWPTPEVMQKTLERFADLGLDIELTELDIPVGEIPGTMEQKLVAQTELARGVVRACLAVPRCKGITFWGLTDRHSWLASPEWAHLRGKGPHLPLPFDENYRPKPMVNGILEALRAE